MPTSTQGFFGTSQVFALWGLILGLVLLGWALATAAVGSGHGARSRRGAIAVGSAGLVGLGTFWLLRGILSLFSLPSLPVAVQNLTGRGSALNLYDLLLILAVIQALLFPVWCVSTGLVHRRFCTAPLFRVPLRIGVALVLGLAALAAVSLLKSISISPAGAGLIDLLAALPMTCVALAIWAGAERTAPPLAPKAAEEPATPAAPDFDVPAQWRRLGAIAPKDAPIEVFGGQSAESAPGWSSTAWDAAGAAGAPPAALDELSALWDQPGHAYLVGDAPDVTERALTVASGMLAVLAKGMRCIVITAGARTGAGDTAASYRDELLRAFEAMGAWPAGEFSAGTQELKDALAQNRLPAVAFFDVNDLSAGGIGAMCGPRNSAGVLWAANVGLILVSKIDRGAPIQVTHRLFTLRRLSLALRAAGARWSVQATGFSGSGSRSLLERAFPGLPAREVPLGMRSSASVKAWLVNEEFRARPGDAWVKRALAPVANANLQVSVGDPLGSFDRSVRMWGKDFSLIRDLSLSGRASASALNEAWLVASFRALRHLPPRADGQPHDALWGVSPSPVTRFLLENKNLQQLLKRERLPSPRPLVGHDNALVATAHLRAAIAEGDGLQDLESLRNLFGGSLVDKVIGPGVRPTRWVVRSLPSTPDLLRTPLAPVTTRDLSNPIRETVTEKVVRIVEENGGAELLRIDEFLAPTRFYPGRVFAHGEVRYRVPYNAYDQKRQEMRVEQAQGQPLTAPLLDIAIQNPSMVQAVRERAFGGLRYQVAGLEVTAVEQVTGARQVDAGPEPKTEQYDAVTTQYRTKAVGVFFQGPLTLNAVTHLARCLDGVLVAMLLAGDEDVEVVPVQAGLIDGVGAGIAAVDRHVGGMGIIGALDGETLDQALQWVRAILQSCACPNGCPRCTPARALAEGPDKASVLRLLGA